MSEEKNKEEDIFEKVKHSCASFGEARRIALFLKDKPEEEVEAFLKRREK